MSKKACLEACDTAMNSTAVANDKNTAEAHGTAASQHRIAAEHAKLNDDDALHAKHKDLAEQHDLAASNCTKAAGNKVLPKDGSAVPVLASGGNGLDHHKCLSCEHEFKGNEGKMSEDGKTMNCPKCGKPQKMEIDSGKSFAAKLNELSAARLETSEPLKAATSLAGISLNDLRDKAGKAICELDVCKPANQSPGSICGCWVADIIAPEHEAGENWDVIFTGADGKLYRVWIGVTDGEVKVTGEPVEVERTTGYRYVNDMENNTRITAKIDLESLRFTFW